MNQDHTIVAHFSGITSFTLKIDGADHGSVTLPGEDTFTYPVGAVVQLLAVADTGYSFEKWEGDKSTIANEHAADTTITMNGNYKIHPRFRH
jgi:hypothetical protein